MVAWGGLAPAASTVMRLRSQMSMPSPVRPPSGQSQAPPRGRSSILCLGMKRKRAAARGLVPAISPFRPCSFASDLSFDRMPRATAAISHCSFNLALPLPRCAGLDDMGRLESSTSMFPNQPPCPRHSSAPLPIPGHAEDGGMAAHPHHQQVAMPAQWRSLPAMDEHGIPTDAIFCSRR